ncbi:MAG: hypothetical protein HQ503_10215 [Rhodospirillales bacterium]|nr:hypothetical protein [Rhodospirillales bacterium]
MEKIDLPGEFEFLQDLGADWLIADEHGRHIKRVTSDIETVRAFYEKVVEHLDAMIAYLQPKDSNNLAPADHNLYLLALVCIEMSHPIDLGWESTDIDDTFPWQRIEFLPVAEYFPGLDPE